MVHHTVSLSIAPAEEVKSTMVKVEFSYPKDWKGPRYFKDGDVKEMSPEAAQSFIDMGIASDAVRKPKKK